MATITVTPGKVFTSGETVTVAAINSLGVPSAVISGIQSSDLSDSAVTTAKIANEAVTGAKLATTLSLAGKTLTLPNSAALSVIGNGTNASAAPTDLAAGSDGHVLRRSGTALAFGTVATDGLADRSVTAAKINSVITIDQKTADYTLALEDRGKMIDVNSASARIVTIPTAASVAFPTGSTVIITRRAAGEVSIAGASGVTVRSQDSKLRIDKQYAAVAVIKIGTNEWLLVGALKA